MRKTLIIGTVVVVGYLWRREIKRYLDHALGEIDPRERKYYDA